MVQIANQLLAHLAETTVLLPSHMYCTGEHRFSASRALPNPSRPSSLTPTGLTSQCGQLLGVAEVEHGAHQLRARLLQEDGQDGPAVSVHHLLALIGQGYRQFRAYCIKSMNYFFLKHKRIMCEDGRLGRPGREEGSGSVRNLSLSKTISYSQIDPTASLH